jgi:hypothetical protein
MCNKMLVKNKGRDYLVDLDRDGRVVFKWVSKE